MLKSNNIQGAE